MNPLVQDRKDSHVQGINRMEKVEVESINVVIVDFHTIKFINDFPNIPVHIQKTGHYRHLILVERKATLVWNE